MIKHQSLEGPHFGAELARLSRQSCVSSHTPPERHFVPLKEKFSLGGKRVSTSHSPPSCQDFHHYFISNILMNFQTTTILLLLLFPLLLVVGPQTPCTCGRASFLILDYMTWLLLWLLKQSNVGLWTERWASVCGPSKTTSEDPDISSVDHSMRWSLQSTLGFPKILSKLWTGEHKDLLSRQRGLEKELLYWPVGWFDDGWLGGRRGTVLRKSLDLEVSFK